MQKLIAAVLLVLAACTEPTTVSPPDRTGKLEPVAPTSCARACRVELGACSSSEEDLAAIKDCANDCPFSTEEARCLASLSCGDDPSVCQ